MSAGWNNVCCHLGLPALFHLHLGNKFCQTCFPACLYPCKDGARSPPNSTPPVYQGGRRVTYHSPTETHLQSFSSKSFPGHRTAEQEKTLHSILFQCLVTEETEVQEKFES